jgi:hypothetical protein
MKRTNELCDDCGDAFPAELIQLDGDGVNRCLSCWLELESQVIDAEDILGINHSPFAGIRHGEKDGNYERRSA